MGGESTQPQLLKPHQRQPQITTPGQLQHQHRHLFPIGSFVEVRTNEEDFKGVYFAATVIAPPSPPFRKKKGSRRVPKKLYVEYHNLLADEDGSKRLTESVDLSFVRPAPPPQELVSGFEPDDVVDAFHKDGWWTGTITRALPGGERFVVTFLYPPDELEFGLADLRVHWDWVDGSWVRPVEQSVEAVMFDVGRKVEVSLEGKDFEAWFPATIHEVLEDGILLAEYRCASADNNHQTLKLKVDSPHVRPCPPLLKDKAFVLLEKVDAYFDFGWWSGIITKVLEDSKYTVFFQQSKKVKEFHLSELRPHMEWKSGRWFTSSQDVAIPAPDDEMHEHHIPKNNNGHTGASLLKSSGDGKGTSDGQTPSLNLRKDQFEQLTPVNAKDSDVASSLGKRRQHSSGSGGALSQPPKKLRKGNVGRSSPHNAHDASTKEMLTTSPTPAVKNKTDSAAAAAAGDQSSDNPSWGKRIQRQQRKVSATQSVDKKMNRTSISMKKCSVQSMEDESPGTFREGKDPGNPAESAKSVHAEEDTELPVVIGLPCAEIGSSEFGTSKSKRVRHSNIKGIVKHLSDKQLQLNEIKDSEKQETGELSVKRKRGRPKKIAIEILLTPATEISRNGDGASDNVIRKDGDSHGIPEGLVVSTEDLLPTQEMALSEGKEKSANDLIESANGQSDPSNEKGSLLKRMSTKAHDEKVVKQSTGARQKRSSKRGRRRGRGGTVASRIQDSTDASARKMVQENCSVEINEKVTEAPCSGPDDEPLSKWIEGMHSPALVNGSRESPVSTVEQCTEKGEKQRDALAPEEDNEKLPETECHASISLDEGSVVPYEQLSLPFVKNTVLWKTIEAMEVFKRIPQRPHFQPLENFKESSREGLAIGYMVTFASVAEKASKLQFNDPQSVTDDILETLADLEKHGFNTRVIQDRVTELLAVKDRQGNLLDEADKLNSQILVHNREKIRIEEEISQMNEQIRKLQEKLSLAESSKEEENDKIASLQARLQETDEKIKNVERDFEVIAGSKFSSV